MTGRTLNYSSALSSERGQDTVDQSTSAVREWTRWKVLVHQLSAPLPKDVYSASTVSSATVVQASARASAFDLLLYAERRLGRLESEGAIVAPGEVIEAARRLLGRYVRDDGPTPQVGATHSGSVEIQWLAGGNLLAALFEQDGSYNVSLLDANHVWQLDYDSDPHSELPDDVAVKVEDALGEMKTKVRTRPGDFLR